MLKLLLFVLVLFAVYWVPRLLRQKNAARRGGASPSGRSADAERMLPCANCGLHVPESDGVRRDEAFYCCEAHARNERD